ncbi:MAG: TonB-dependent siderophore receptor [Burkholderiales bacterium]|nr:TonB-dependent siderophore receptor [Burkholderiales bacterium]
MNVRSERDREPGSYQPGITSVGKLEQLAKDVPQSLTIVPETLWQDQNATTLREALRNVPGLTFNAGEGGRIGDNFTIRGYSAVGDLYLDGIRDNAQYERDLFNLQQVDVLRGAASMIFGRGSTGGIVNQVSKQPVLQDQYTASLTVGNYSYARAVADLNKLVGENAAVRLNVMGTNAESSRDEVFVRRWGIAPAVRWGIGTRDEFYLAYFYLDYEGLPDYGVPFFQGRPLDVPVTRFYGLANADYQRDTAGIATASWIHRFSPDTNLKTVLRQGTYKRDLWATAPRLAGNPAQITDSTAVNRQRQARGAEEQTLTLQSDFTTRFVTGTVQHWVLAGVEVLREDVHRWTNVGSVANPPTTVGNPNPYPPLPPNYFTSRTRTGDVYFDAGTVGLYAQDIIRFLPQWSLMLGARWDNFRADYDRPLPQGDLNRTDRVWSYRTGLLFQPSDYQSYYLAYGTAFNPSGELYALDDRTANTPPEESRNLELGGKWEAFDGNLSLAAAVFRTEKTNERNTDLSIPNLSLLSGKRHTDGIEIQAAGRLTPNWEVFAGGALMRAKIDQASGQQANTQGMVPINTPSYTYNVWTTYRLPEGWRVGGGFYGVGDRYANATNTNVVPGYTRWDAMLAYEQRFYALRLNLLNLFNARYYEGVYQGHTVPGTLRAVQLTLELRYD